MQLQLSLDLVFFVLQYNLLLALMKQLQLGCSLVVTVKF